MKIKNNLSKYKSYIINLLMPALVFGFITGVFTSVIVCLYKLCANHIIEFSASAYGYLREHAYFVPLAILGAFGVSMLLAYIYKKTPNIKGGGIPTSVGILRGIITFKWLRTLVGVFALSLTSFLFGVPLGNEGPSVQMGTAVGRGSVYTFAKKHRAWDRYSMTGGACAGFAVATGAPISGILFSVEEAHQRISPTIIIVASSSVLFANITSKLLCPLFGISENLFDLLDLPTLSLKDYWLPLVVGIGVGLFSVLFLYYYRIIDKLHDKVLARVPHGVKIFVIFALTIVVGLVSFSFVSTGHELIVEIGMGHYAIWFLILVLLVRTTLTLSANASGITGGTFIPVLAIGALVASIMGKTFLAWGLDSSLYTTIVMLGITACIAGAMKMPLTAIVFSLEALSSHNNIVPVIIVSFVAFLITEIFEVKSVSDVIIELREDFEEDKSQHTVVEKDVVVMPGSFAVGKQIRDIFWPRNLFVLSLKHPNSEAKVDEHGGKAIGVGDVLHIRYSTADELLTEDELAAIVGEQPQTGRATAVCS